MGGSYNLQVKAVLEYVLSLPVNVIDNVAASQLLFDGNPMNFIFFYTLFFSLYSFMYKRFVNIILASDNSVYCQS